MDQASGAMRIHGWKDTSFSQRFFSFLDLVDIQRVLHVSTKESRKRDKVLL